jgi:hypothetical protein
MTIRRFGARFLPFYYGKATDAPPDQLVNFYEQVHFAEMTLFAFLFSGFDKYLNRKLH